MSVAKRRAADRWAAGSKIADTLRLEAIMSVGQVIEGRVLDLGCGRKPYRDLLGPGLRWIGVDLPATYSGRPDADVYGSALAIPFGTETFNTVICTEVLEHVISPHALFDEATRVLKPMGHLVLTVPQVNPLHEEPHDYFRVTCHALAMLAARNRLEVIALKPHGGAIATTGQLVAWHMGWTQRVPIVGRLLRPVTVGTISWLALSLDALSKRSKGATKDTLGWTFVGRKPVPARTS